MLRKSDRPKPIAPTGHSARNDASFSVIAADAVIIGNIEASAMLHLDGTVEGDIVCASFVQGESGRVKGAVRADSVRLAGCVEGAVEAGSLIIEQSARITGDVGYETLSIAEGGVIEGRLITRSAAAPLLLPTQIAEPLAEEEE